MTKAFEEFKKKVSLPDKETEELYRDLEKYMSLSMHLNTIEGKIMGKIMKTDFIEEIKYIGQHALAGSTLDWLIKSRIDFLEGRPNEYEVYLNTLVEKFESKEKGA